MPRSQIASVSNFDFGAPVVEAVVLQFRVLNGGKVGLRFENEEGGEDGVVTVQVSADGSSWVDTNASDNGQAVADVTVQRGTYKDYVVNLRAAVDLYLRVQASGGTRMVLQVRDDAGLEITTI